MARSPAADAEAVGLSGAPAAFIGRAGRSGAPLIYAAESDLGGRHGGVGRPAERSR